VKIYVIAGDRRQADIWIKSNLEKRRISGETTLSWSDYVVVTNPDRIMGVRDPHGVFIGTWRERKDIIDIMEFLLARSSNNTRLQEIYKELRT
jgi:hypothetical protein